MNYRLGIASVAISVALFMAVAQACRGGCFQTGNSLRSDIDGYQRHIEWMNDTQATGFNHSTRKSYMATIFYIEGVVDGSELIAKRGGIPEGVTIGQLINIVSRYVDSHPERWHEPAGDLIIDAVEQAFFSQSPEQNQASVRAIR